MNYRDQIDQQVRMIIERLKTRDVLKIWIHRHLFYVENYWIVECGVHVNSHKWHIYYD